MELKVFKVLILAIFLTVPGSIWAATTCEQLFEAAQINTAIRNEFTAAGIKGLTHFTSLEILPLILTKNALIPPSNLSQEELPKNRNLYGMNGKVYMFLSGREHNPSSLDVAAFVGGITSYYYGGRTLHNGRPISQRSQGLDRVYLYFDLDIVASEFKYHIGTMGMHAYGNFDAKTDFIYTPPHIEAQSFKSKWATPTKHTPAQLKEFLAEDTSGEVVFYFDHPLAPKGLPLSSLRAIWVAAPMYELLISKLKEKEITSIHGIPIEEFVKAIPLNQNIEILEDGWIVVYED